MQIVKHTFSNDPGRVSLPFELFSEVIDVNIVQARIYSQQKHNLNPFVTWHQITCEFVYADPNNKKEIIRYNVFERRECDSEPNSWRICDIGSLNKENIKK